jgi:hypothetical protein
MSQELIKRIDKRYDAVKTQRATWENLWQKVLDHADPHYTEIYHQGINYAHGMRGDRRIYDSSGTQGHETLTLALHSSMYPANQPFIQFTLKDQRILDQNPSMGRWLANVDKDINQAIQDSNFHDTIDQGMADYTAIGWFNHFLETYDMHERKFGDLIFKTNDFTNVFPISSRDGFVRTIILVEGIPIHQLAEYPEYEKAVKASDKLSEKLKKEEDEQIVLIHYIAPKDDRTPTLAKRMTYIHFVYTLEDKIPLNMQTDTTYRGFEELPFFNPRWRMRSNEPYPRSPGMAVLGDMQSMQKLAKMRLQAAGLQVNPPTYEIEGAMEGTPKILPNARNIFKRPDAFGYIEPRQRMDVGWVETEKLKANIDAGFHINDFRFPDNLPQMTAMEAGIRATINQTTYASILVRSGNSHVKPMANRMFWIRYRSGYIDPPPVAISPDQLDIINISPLARAQRKNDVIESESLLRSIGEMSPAFPGITNKIDSNKYIDWRVERTNTSFFDFIRTDEESDQMTQQQQVVNAVPEGARALKDFSTAQLNEARRQNA